MKGLANMFNPTESMYVYKQYIPALTRLGGVYDNPVTGSRRCLMIYPITGKWYDYDLGIGGNVEDFVSWANDIGLQAAIGYILSIIDGLDGMDMIVRRNDEIDYSGYGTSIRGKSMTIEQLESATYRLLASHDIVDNFNKLGIDSDSLIRNRIGLVSRSKLKFIIYPSDIINGMCRHYRGEGYGKENNSTYYHGVPNFFIKPVSGCNEAVACLDRITTLMLDSIGIRAHFINMSNYSYFVDKKVIVLNSCNSTKHAGKIQALLNRIDVEASLYDISTKFLVKNNAGNNNTLAHLYYQCGDKSNIIKKLQDELYVKDDR